MYYNALTTNNVNSKLTTKKDIFFTKKLNNLLQQKLVQITLNYRFPGLNDMSTFMVFSDFILDYQFIFAKIHSLFVCDLFIFIHLCLYFWLSFFTKNDLQERYIR